ncbi:MAG: TIM barrel protein [Lentisphaerae bacterium]|nr:TIM barrel protein [Lentisphaerota bacterium]
MKADVLLDLFYTELPIKDRINHIADAGWKAVETWMGGDAAELKEVGNACREREVEFVSMVMNFNNDNEVAPVRKTSRAAFLERIDRYSDNALAAGCSRGIVTSGDRVTGEDYYTQLQSLTDALAAAAELAGRKGFHLNIEPLNDKVDHPGYFLVSREEAVSIVRTVASPHLRFLYDLYHQQIMTGDHTAFLAANIEWVGHFHAAGVPGRHEIFSGEMDYPYIVRRIREMGYRGYLGLEYMPALEHGESLRRSVEHLASALGDAV